MNRQLYAFLPLALLSACASMPHLDLASTIRPGSALGSDKTLPPGAGLALGDKWWTSFGDAQLDTLVVEGLAASPDVVSAAARIRAADAIAQQDGATLGPRLAIDGQVGGVQQSKNLGIPPQFVPSGIQDTGRLTGQLSFDLDLWGKNRAALAAARGEAEAARVDAAQARLLVATSIAAAYADLGQSFAQRDVAVEALKLRQSTAALTARRVAVGVDTRGSQAQADSRVPQARADILALDETIGLTRNRLAALVGAGPDRGRGIVRPVLASVAFGIPANAGIELVGRRPDVIAAKLRVEAAAQRIKVARADFYPNLSLGALVGLQSLGLGNLFQGNSSYGNGGLAVSLPAFDTGRIQGRYRGARAEYDEAVARYDSTLIEALHQAADAVASRNAADQRLAELKLALASAKDASRIAGLRYSGGLSNQLPALTSDDTLLVVLRAVTDLEARRIALEIALVRALGGGYRNPIYVGTK